ncbi:MAG: hypothetical protein V4857_13605 [Pseudomonadota bacterium]
MAKPKRKLTRAEKAEFETIFINGKQKRVRRLTAPEQFKNADPVWLHQNELWEYMPPAWSSCSALDPLPADADDGLIPF